MKRAVFQVGQLMIFRQKGEKWSLHNFHTHRKQRERNKDGQQLHSFRPSILLLFSSFSASLSALSLAALSVGVSYPPARQKPQVRPWCVVPFVGENHRPKGKPAICGNRPLQCPCFLLCPIVQRARKVKVDQSGRPAFLCLQGAAKQSSTRVELNILRIIQLFASWIRMVGSMAGL